MGDELTAVDIKKIKEELDYRTKELRPKLIEEVKRTRAFGDLSENFEYKSAKQEKNHNDSRIRYLERVLKNAVIVSADHSGDEVGLFDKVTIYIEEDDEEQQVQIVTSMRQNALEGRITGQSPVGKAIMGHKVGERVCVTVSEDYSYWVEIRRIEKSGDDENIPILAY